MKKIFRLARLELALLFYSPIAWLTMVIFIIVASYAYTNLLTILEDTQFLGINQVNLSGRMFFDRNDGGVIWAVQSKLYFFIPLLTMGLMSREISSGSLKLLLSSPVKISEIILGKFFAIMLYGFIMMAVVTLFLFFGIFTVDKLDVGLVLSGMFGVYLLLCTYAAIGLFMSSLTAYQVVAALLTFSIFAAMEYVATLWQNYDLIRDLTYNISIAGRTNQMLDGLITSKDVIYFLTIISVFLGLTMLRLQANRQSTPAGIKWLRYSGVVIAAIAIGYISSRPKLIAYWDTTEVKHQTISKASQEILKSLKEPMEVTTYVNLFEDNFFDFAPNARNYDLRRLERYQRFHRDMKINYVYYYDSSSSGNWRFAVNKGKPIEEIAAKDIENMRLPSSVFLKPGEIKKLIQLEPVEDNRTVRELKIGKGRGLVRGTYDDFIRYAGEREWMTAIKRMQDGPETLLFVMGHTEKDIYKYGDREALFMVRYPRFRESLLNQGIFSDTISLETQEIPDSIMALAIIDPKLNFSPREMERLKKYIDKGGNLIIGGELRKRELMDKLLMPLGLRFIDSTPLHSAQHTPGDFVFGSFMAFPGKVNDSLRPIGEFGMNGAAALAPNGVKTDFKEVVMVQTDTVNTWFRPGLVDVQDSSKVRFSPSLGDSKRIEPLAMHLSRKVNNREQRIIVTGDANMYANHGLNLGIILEVVKWFTNGKYPMEFKTEPMKDTKITVDKKQILVLKWILIGVFPALAAIAGTILLIRRKRK